MSITAAKSRALSLALCLACLGAAPLRAQNASRASLPAGGDRAHPGFQVTNAAGDTLLLLPKEEILSYRVHVGVAFLRAAVGTVTQTCVVEPYRRSIFMVGSGERQELEAATLSIHATGDYSLYTLDSTIESRHLPQDWPRIIYRLTQNGSSKRRRENLIGTRDGVPTSSYRRDTTHGAPSGGRIWRDARHRNISDKPLDLLSSVFACRTLIQSGEASLSFPMLEKDRLWELTLTRGAEEVVDTDAGVFDGVEVILTPRPWPGEVMDQEDIDKFEGLFGLHGVIKVWCDVRTGIPLRIQGDLPVGPITIRIDVLLDAFSGTVPELHPAGQGSVARPEHGAEAGVRMSSGRPGADSPSSSDPQNPIRGTEPR